MVSVRMYPSGNLSGLFFNCFIYSLCLYALHLSNIKIDDNFFVSQCDNTIFLLR